MVNVYAVPRPIRLSSFFQTPRAIALSEFGKMTPSVSARYHSCIIEVRVRLLWLALGDRAGAELLGEVHGNQRDRSEIAKEMESEQTSGESVELSAYIGQRSPVRIRQKSSLFSKSDALKTSNVTVSPTRIMTGTK